MPPQPSGKAVKKAGKAQKAVRATDKKKKKKRRKESFSIYIYKVRNQIVKLFDLNTMIKNLGEIKSLLQGGNQGEAWFQKTFIDPLIEHAGKEIGAAELLTIINKSLNGGETFSLPAKPTCPNSSQRRLISLSLLFARV